MGIKQKYAGFPKWFKYFSAILGVVLLANILAPSDTLGTIIEIITFLMTTVYVVAGFIILIIKSYRNQ